MYRHLAIILFEGWSLCVTSHGTETVGKFADTLESVLDKDWIILKGIYVDKIKKNKTMNIQLC